jgi:hypothetical protein
MEMLVGPGGTSRADGRRTRTWGMGWELQRATDGSCIRTTMGGKQAGRQAGKLWANGVDKALASDQGQLARKRVWTDREKVQAEDQMA